MQSDKKENWKEETTLWFDKIEAQLIKTIQKAKEMLLVCPDQQTSKQIANSFASYVVTMFKTMDSAFKPTTDMAVQTDILHPEDLKASSLAYETICQIEDRRQSS